MAAPTSSVVNAYQDALDSLTTLAFRDIVGLIQSSRGRGPEAVRDALLDVAPQLVNEYGSVAVDLAVEQYMESRTSAGVTGRFTPTTTGWRVDGERIESLIRWGVAPEFIQSASTTEMLIGGGLQRIISGGFRDTVATNMAQDRVAYGVARKPRAGCCAFCAMLSTRVYESAEIATRVSGRQYSARGHRRRAYGDYVTRTRGTQGLGDRFHDYCRCATVTVFRTGDSIDEWADISAVNHHAEEYMNAYAEARNQYADDGYPGDNQASEILKRMRANGFAR